MKKTLLTIAVLAGTCFFVQAQDSLTMTSKRGIPILPETGEYGLGFSADPIFQYIGNIFNKDANNNTPDYDFISNKDEMVIWGKMVKAPDTHYRASLRLGFGTDKNNYEVAADSANGLGYADERKTSDEIKTKRNHIVIGVGMEKRRGKGRVQGYYGPEVLIGFAKEKTEYSYGNRLDSTNQAPNTSINQPNPGSYITETTSGSTFQFTLRAFAGVEYFFMAKASLGLEFGWGISLASSAASESSFKQWDALNNEVKTTKEEDSNIGGKRSSFNIDTDNAYGSLKCIFYF